MFFLQIQGKETWINIYKKKEKVFVIYDELIDIFSTSFNSYSGCLDLSRIIICTCMWRIKTCPAIFVTRVTQNLNILMHRKCIYFLHFNNC